MRFVAISDTHNRGLMHVQGDVLLHAGDLTGRGTETELIKAAEDLAGYPCKKVVIIPGNHDFLFEEDEQKARDIFESRIRGVKILINQETELYGVRIYGSPYTPKFGEWAFGYKPDEAHNVWSKVPVGMDILVTHGPPRFVMDMAPRGEHCGCDILAQHIYRVKPKFHIFGHIHCGYGIQQDSLQQTTYINAAACSEKYYLLNPPIVFHYGQPGNYERW